MEIIRDPCCVAGYRYEDPVSDLPSLTHCGEIYCTNDHFVPLHTHEAFEFLYLIAGTAYWQIRETVYVQNPGELFWTLPEEPHLSAKQPHLPYHFLWFGVRLDNLSRDSVRVAESLRTLSRQGRHVMSDAREMETVIRGLTLQVIAQRTGCAQVCASYLHTFLSLLTQSITEEKPSTAASYGGAACYPVRQAVTFMHNNLHRHVKLEEIATASHLSVSQLCFNFRRFMDISPAAYHLQLRLEAARDVLLHPEMSITQVAMEFGFASSQHFSMDFRKTFGITPQEWKRGSTIGSRHPSENPQVATAL